MGLSVSALQLHYVGETSIKTGTRFQKSEIGGLSGIVWDRGILYALSDDKGRNGEPRFFEFTLKIEKSKILLSPKAVQFISKVPTVNTAKNEVPQVKAEGLNSKASGNNLIELDPEGLALLSNGNLVLSSEGDNNAKPRQMPRIFQMQKSGAWFEEIELPKKYLPEATGQQKVGVQNNLSFEGLTSIGNSLFAITEAPLVQDEKAGVEGSFVRLLQFESTESSKFKISKEMVYPTSALVNNDKGPQVFNGVSEILALSESKLLVLERGVRIQGKSWACTVSLYLVETGKATNVLAAEKLSDIKFVSLEKTKIIDFETDLEKFRADKKVQNFEALSWGPTLPDGRRSLLVMSDNNFSKNEVTELLVFAVEGE